MKTKYVTLYQIYDRNGNKKLQPFHVYEAAVYMNKLCDINGIVEEIEISLEDYLTKENKS